MALLLQFAGMLFAAVAVTALLRRRRRPSAAMALAMALAAAAAVPLAANAWTSWNVSRDLKRAIPLPRDSAATAAGTNPVFFNWVAERTPRDATFAILPLPPTSTPDYQWALYQLAPRRLVSPDRADVIVFYGAPPKNQPYDKAAFGPVQLQAPSLGIAVRRNAG